MKVYLFGAVLSLSCVGFVLCTTVKDNSVIFLFDVVEIVNKNFCVDNCLKLVEDESMVIAFVFKFSEFLMKGGFYLIKWLL